MKYKHQEKFTSLLLAWHKKHNDRTMPWKGEKDPYKIWLSEIILQQTRVEQGTAYYLKFISTYPTIFDLAKAKDENVFKLWEGLGYYNRCKNLLITARKIVQDYAGIFPNNYQELLQLKGIGEYTAAAIASFAFNKPYAVVDGNVHRVLARFFGINTAIDTTEGKKLFASLTNQVLDKKNAALYNQAIMDFGATICKPFLAQCQQCKLQLYCKAYQTGQVSQLPIKEKKLVQKKRWFNYFVFTYNNKVLVHKRTQKDIWQNLYEFYYVETNHQVQWQAATLKMFLDELGIQHYKHLHISANYQQQLTHQQIKAQFIQVALTAIPLTLKKYTWQQVKTLHHLAKPKIILQFLEQESIKTS
jgi:A/G-specific adenine glycosylase